MRGPHFCLFSLFCLISSQKIPRLKLIPKDVPSLTFDERESLTAMFHDTSSDQVLIGGRGVLWVLTFLDSKITPNQVPMKAEEKAEKDCQKKPGAVQEDCDNFIRVIQRLDDRIIVCGTNAGSPKCWFLVNHTNLQEDRLGRKFTLQAGSFIAPSPSQNTVAIAVEGNLYTALSGNKSVIQRSFGTKKGVKTEESWLGNAEFVGAAFLPEKDSGNDEIFFFYNEVNQSAGLDEEPYKAQLGRVCKVDQGAKSFLVDTWSTFLKARLVCGHPNQPMRFHHLRDAFVLRKEGQNEAVLYGVFSSMWGSSAVCAYSMNRISSIFKTSKFKGVTSAIPVPRPGTCVPLDSNPALPKTTMTFIKEHPEIDTVIYPDEERPLYVLQNNDTYTRVLVDSVQDAENVLHDVLFLGTAKGKIHKVLRSKEQTVIIAEISPFQKEMPVSSMILDPTLGHLYVSTKSEVVRLLLTDCDQYNENCWKCVLARDPYCGWDMDAKSCSAISQEGNRTGRLLQSLDSPNTTYVCDAVEEKLAQEALKKVSVDSTGYIYLPCPLRSHHAIYTWVKDEKTYPCCMDEQSCTLRFGESTPMDQGIFKCTAKEEGYQEEITAFKVTLNSGRIPESSLAVVAAGILFLTITILLL
ncbi:semaphorin-7A-like [Varanus komodoensis]|uniref:semaphorin-7A-like n=1 Tax=Varanus komodoensis TaxID=61221 RepID=UPI001CF77F0F|nr:semaphorin-7A-like [Varanus komodoensis]